MWTTISCAHCKHSIGKDKDDLCCSLRSKVLWVKHPVVESDAVNCEDYEEDISKIDSRVLSLEIISESLQDKKWKTGTGQRVEYSSLSDQHLENALFYLERAGKMGVPNYNFLLREQRRRRLMNEPKRPRVTITKKDMSTTFLDSFFRQVDQVVFDFQLQKLGIKSPEGIFTFNDETGTATINPIDFFSSPVPAYAIRTPLDKVSVGDIVSMSKTRCGFVAAVSGDSKRIRVMFPTGTCAWISPPKNLAFGQAAVMCVQNIFGGGEMNPLLMAMMASEGEGMDIESMAAMTMMGMGGNNVQQMLPLLMLQKGDFGVKDMLLFSALQGGQGGSAMKLFPLATEEPKKEIESGGCVGCESLVERAKDGYGWCTAEGGRFDPIGLKETVASRRPGWCPKQAKKETTSD